MLTSALEATGARTVWLRVWGARREAGALRAALARLAAMRTRTDRLRLLPATLHFDMQPALSLHVSIKNMYNKNLNESRGLEELIT